MSTDHDWQLWGERDPYFGVLTEPRFRRRQLTAESYREFFRLGREEVGLILADCRRSLGEVSTRRTLEFGCGVGRLLIPFAEVSESCCGVDHSAAMRAEAGRNCARFGRDNVRLVATLEEAAALAQRFTFVYSYIVLQHINARRGLRIIESLLDLVAQGGCAALHVTYAHSNYPRRLGAPPLTRGLVRRIRRPFSRLSRRVRGRDPQMQMNTYDLNRVLFLAQRQGVRHGGLRFTDHGGHLGVILYFRRE